MCTIKSIDELLGEVARNLNVQPPVQTKREKNSHNNLNIEAPANRSVLHRLDLRTAKRIASAVECAAEMMGISVVTAVVNGGANLICLEAMDDSYIASVRAAQDKAYTAVALKMPTYKALEESRGGSLDGFTNGNGILMLGGGEPLVCGSEILGGVGVSGGTKEQDTILARVAVEIFNKVY